MRKVKNKKEGFIKGVLALIFSQFVIKIIGIIYKVYLTNKSGYGDEGNAIFASAFQVYAIALTICSVGVPNAISKLVSSRVAIGDNKGAYRIFKIALFLFSFIGFFCSSCIFIFSKEIANNYLQISETEIVLMTLSPAIFFVAIESVFKGYFNGREKITITAKSQVIEQIIKTILTIMIVEIISNVTKNDTELMVIGVTIGATVANLFSLLYLYYILRKNKINVWREVNLSVKTVRNESYKKIIHNILVATFPIAITALLISINKTIDAVTIVRLLKNVVGENEATTAYGILNGKVDTLINLPLSFNLAFSTVLIPNLSFEMAKRNIEI